MKAVAGRLGGSTGRGEEGGPDIEEYIPWYPNRHGGGSAVSPTAEAGAEWGSQRWCWRRELESLIGLLHHAAQVVRPGRSFVHRPIVHLRSHQGHSNHQIRLNREAQTDIQWWRVFIIIWNGVAIRLSSRPIREVSSGSSGSWGCGAYSGTQHNSGFNFHGRRHMNAWKKHCVEGIIANNTGSYCMGAGLARMYGAL